MLLKETEERGRGHLKKKEITEKKQEWRRGDVRRRKIGDKGGSIGKRERRRGGVCRARAVPSQVGTRNRKRERKTRNPEKAHN